MLLFALFGILESSVASTCPVEQASVSTFKKSCDENRFKTLVPLYLNLVSESHFVYLDLVSEPQNVYLDLVFEPQFVYLEWSLSQCVYLDLVFEPQFVDPAPLLSAKVGMITPSLYPPLL